MRGRAVTAGPYVTDVATWAQLSREAPGIAAAGRLLWERHGLMYLATVRGDGSPRVHPVTPVLAGSGVFVAVAGSSPKWRDLHAEPRCVLHCLPGPRDDEVLMRCRAREVPEAVERVRGAATHTIHDDDRLFELDIEQADHGWWENVGRPDTAPVRWRWTPTAGVVLLRSGRRRASRGPG
jgi:hypothetical protein